jgi:hypothetical protein
MMSRVLSLAAALLLCACSSEPEVATTEKQDPIQTLKLIMLGPGSDCSRGADCPSGVCKLGFCATVIDASETWMEQVMAGRLKALLDANPDVKAGMLSEFVPAVEQEDSFVRGRFAGVLGAMGDPDFLPVLRDWSASETERIRVRAQLARLRLADATMLKDAAKLLEHRSAGVRLEATDALGEMAKTSEGAATLLVQQLERGDDRVRHRAIVALGALEQLPAGARPLLEAVLKSESEGHLHHDAMKALGK